MKIITVLTDVEHEDFIHFLKASCHFYNLDLTVLQAYGGYTSHRIKDGRLRAHLNGVDDEQIIFFSDAYDAFFLADETEAVTKFKRFGTPLVFSSEINCWPSADIQRHYPPSSHYFKYLNCGAFIGYAWFLKDIYRRYSADSFATDPYQWSNQYYWHQVYLQNTETIRIDHDCELFYNTSMPLDRSALVTGDDEADRYLLQEEINRLGNEISFSGNRIHYNYKRTFPVHVHFPGRMSKQIMKGDYFNAVKRWAG